MFTTFAVMAGVAAQANRPERAARLFGASDRLRAEAGQTPERQIALSQDVYDRAVASARARMGTVAFSAARAAGRALPLEQALTEALENQSVQMGSSKQESTLLLTPREDQVARLLAGGLSNRQIAERLVITEATAAKHVEHIREKLSVTSRAQVAAWLTQTATGGGLSPQD
jgi:non-specific serine/threonine protein kinase